MKTMKKLVLFIAFITAVAQLAQAQKEFKKGNKLYKKEKYSKALAQYEKALASGATPDNASNVKIANTYFYLDKKLEAKDIYDSMSKDDLDADGLTNYGIICFEEGNYSKATSMFETASRNGSKNPLNNIYKQSCTWAQANSEPAGYSVNKSDIIIDDKSFGVNYLDDGIVYSLKAVGSNEKDPHGFYYTDINFVLYDNAVVGTPEPLGENLNSKVHDGAVTLNTEMDHMYFTRIEYSKKGVHMEVYESKLEGETWSKPKALSFNSGKHSCAYPALHPDGNMLYFASDMKGGKGGMDLYFVQKSGDKWGNPVNCGGDINTPGDEVYPYINPDGDLFYSTDGKLGYGGLDIFFAIGSGTNWSGITNMKKPINSSRDDFAYVQNPYNAENALLSSNRGRDGMADHVYTVKTVTLEVANDGIEDFLNETSESGSIDDFLTNDDAENTGSNEYNAGDSENDGFLSGGNETETGEANETGEGESLTFEQQLQNMMGEDAIIYRVQFMSSRKPLNKVKLDETGDFVYRYFYQGLYRYTIGEFYEAGPAIELKEKLQKFGYTDAFVATFRQGERVLDIQIYDH